MNRMQPDVKVEEAFKLLDKVFKSRKPVFKENREEFPLKDGENPLKTKTDLDDYRVYIFTSIADENWVAYIHKITSRMWYSGSPLHWEWLRFVPFCDGVCSPTYMSLEEESWLYSVWDKAKRHKNLSEFLMKGEKNHE